MKKRTWVRAVATFGAIIVVVLCAIVVDLSGTGVYTLSLWQPVVLHPGLDLGGGMRVVLRAHPAPGQVLDDRAMERTRRIIADRIGYGLRLTSPIVRTLARSRSRYVSVEWVGSKTVAPTVQFLLQSRGQLSIIGLHEIPPGQPLVHECGKKPHPLEVTDLIGASARGYPVLARGEDVIVGSVAIGTNTLGGAPAVDATLVPATAARLTREIAARHISVVGIAIDSTIYDVRPSGHLLPVGNQFSITKTTGSACKTTLISTTIDLAIMLKYGVMPVTLQMVSVQAVGPLVQLVNVDKLGLVSLIILVLVASVLCVRYRLAAVVAIAALFVDVVVAVAVVKVVALTLTLAGLAGFSLAVIIAVDVQRVVYTRVSSRRLAADFNQEHRRMRPTTLDPAAIALLISTIFWWVGTASATGALTDFATTLFMGVTIVATTALAVRAAIQAATMA